MVGVAQLVRAPGCGPGGRGFEPHHSPHHYENDFFEKSFLLTLYLFYYINNVYPTERNLMRLLVDESFANTGDSLGALDGCMDFAKTVDEPYSIQTCDIRAVAGSRLDKNQFDASHVLSAYEPSRSEIGEPVAIITSLDLNARADGGEWLNFIFGLSWPEMSCITSTYRFDHRDANRLITMHELGHVWGLVANYSPSADKRSGLYTGHCTNICTMRQVMSVAEAAELAARLGSRSFCENCRHHLTSQRL